MRPLDSDLPLEDLDAALSPVRRSLAFALREGLMPPHLPGAVLPPLRRAVALELPEPIDEQVTDLLRLAEGLVEGAEDGSVAALFAALTRLDGLLGLPVPRRVRVPSKQRYTPQPPDPDPHDDAPVEASDGKGTQPPRSEAREPEASPAEAKAPSPPPWNGDPRVHVDAVLPGAGLPDLTVADLLALRPTGHDAVDGVHGAGRALPDAPLVSVGGRARERVTVCHPDGSVTERLLLVGAGPLWCRWDTHPMPHESLLPADGRVVLVGRPVDGELVDAEVVAEGGTARPRYDGDEARIREALVRLAPMLGRLRDPVSGDVLSAHGLLARGPALAAAHDARVQQQEAARQRLAFDEALFASLGAVGRMGRGDRGIPHTVVLSGVSTLQRHGVELSDEQQLVFEDLKRDLRRSTPMRRVMTGEVGAGKGTVALLAMAVVAEGKGQVLVLGPDTSESAQRFLHTEPLLRELGLVARQVADEPSASVKDAIQRGEIHVVFGTHALLNAELPFRRLGLVVSMERFPFGPSGIAALPNPRPDLLVLTQVPVGASVLSSAYADFEVSVVRHASRHPARIEVVQATERDRAYATLRDAVGSGQQGTVLFPRVRGADALGLGDARRVVQALEASELEGCRVALLHSQQGLDEQRRTFDDFLHRRVDVLVTTMALEDGPAVPGLVATVVEQADHVEQWRLHRVIGFLSTSALSPVAMLVVGEHASSDAENRIQRVLDAPDGYTLTESRVQVRGLDACVAEGVPPRPSFVALSLQDDLQWVLAARDEAHRLLRSDPKLRRGSHQELARELRERWTTLWPDAGEEWSCPFTDDTGGGDRKRRRRRRRRR
mgnify:CR=1 FL=1